MYLLDANVMITAKNQHYGFDFVPGFWDWLDQQHAAGQLSSTRMVFDELVRGNDDLASWAAERSHFFHESDILTLASMSQLAQWVQKNAQYTPGAKHEFLSVADFELVAHAHAHNLTVITRERPTPTSQRKIFIPDVCEALEVAWDSPFAMLRRLGARFVLPRR